MPYWLGGRSSTRSVTAALLTRTVEAAAIAIAVLVVLLVWKGPAGTEGAMLDLVVRFYRPVVRLILAAVLLVTLLPLLVWAFRRLR